MEGNVSYYHADNAHLNEKTQGVQPAPGQSSINTTNPGTYGTGADILTKGGPETSGSRDVPQGNLPAKPADTHPVD